MSRSVPYVMSWCIHAISLRTSTKNSHRQGCCICTFQGPVEHWHRFWNVAHYQIIINVYMTSSTYCYNLLLVVLFEIISILSAEYVTRTYTGPCEFSKIFQIISCHRLLQRRISRDFVNMASFFKIGNVLNYWQTVTIYQLKGSCSPVTFSHIQSH